MTAGDDGSTSRGRRERDAWRDRDEDVDIFVFAAEDESLTPATGHGGAAPVEPPPEVDSDWNDTSWLQDLDGGARSVAPPTPPAGRADVSDERLDEAVQVLADASGAASADGSAEADVAELLRELSLLSLDD